MTIAETLRFFRSAIKSGEPWSAACEAAFNEAHAHASARTGPEWMPIESAPKGRTVLVGYPNPLGNWRTVKASYYPPNTLELSEESEGYFDDDATGYAPEGWYEETETHEVILPLECEPTHWQPLPVAPEPR